MVELSVTQKKHIVVVGVGALGSHFVQFARNLNAAFTVIDFDKIESKNVLSQFHTNMGKGKNKANALQMSMRGLFGVNLLARMHKLTSDNVEVLLSPAELIVDCVDNGATRRLIQTFAKANNIPCLHGGLAADGIFGRVMWTELFVIDDEPGEGVATCEDGEHLPFITMVASQMAIKVQAFLDTGKKHSAYVSNQGVKVI